MLDEVKNQKAPENQFHDHSMVYKQKDQPISHGRCHFYTYFTLYQTN